MPEHHFKVEEFEDRLERNRRYQELKATRRHGLVKFSGVKELEPELRRRKSPRNTRYTIVARAVFCSTWSVAYPLH